MESVNVTIRLDKDTKSKADKLFEELGINFTTAINMYLKQVIRTKGIPFTITTEVPNKITLDALNEYNEIRKPNSSYQRYDSFDEAINDVIKDNENSSF